MKKFVTTYTDYLNQEKLRLIEEIRQLEIDHCEDEAKFKRVEANIVDIFTQMFSISIKKTTEDGNWRDDFKSNYLIYFDKIPHNWIENLKRCTEYDAYEEAHIEEIKINKAKAIKEAFLFALEQV